jgi:hypothetical protein
MSIVQERGAAAAATAIPDSQGAGQMEAAEVAVTAAPEIGAMVAKGSGLPQAEAEAQAAAATTTVSEAAAQAAAATLAEAAASLAAAAGSSTGATTLAQVAATALAIMRAEAVTKAAMTAEGVTSGGARPSGGAGPKQGVGAAASAFPVHAMAVASESAPRTCSARAVPMSCAGAAAELVLSSPIGTATVTEAAVRAPTEAGTNVEEAASLRAAVACPPTATQAAAVAAIAMEEVGPSVTGYCANAGVSVGFGSGHGGAGGGPLELQQVVITRIADSTAAGVATAAPATEGDGAGGGITALDLALDVREAGDGRREGIMDGEGSQVCEEQSEAAGAAGTEGGAVGAWCGNGGEGTGASTGEDGGQGIRCGMKIAAGVQDR